MWEDFLGACNPKILVLRGKCSATDGPSTCGLVLKNEFWLSWTRLTGVSYSGESICVDRQGEVLIKPKMEEGKVITYLLERGSSKIGHDRAPLVLREEKLREEMVRWGRPDGKGARVARLLVIREKKEH